MSSTTLWNYGYAPKNIYSCWEALDGRGLYWDGKCLVTFSRSIFSQRSSRAATFSRRLSISILVPSIIASVRATSGDDADAPFIIVLGSASSPLMMRRRRRRAPAGPPLPPALPLPLLPGEYLHRAFANTSTRHSFLWYHRCKENFVQRQNKNGAMRKTSRWLNFNIF